MRRYFRSRFRARSGTPGHENWGIVSETWRDAIARPVYVGSMNLLSPPCAERRLELPRKNIMVSGDRTEAVLCLAIDSIPSSRLARAAWRYPLVSGPVMGEDEWQCLFYCGAAISQLALT